MKQGLAPVAPKDSSLPTISIVNTGLNITIKDNTTYSCFKIIFAVMYLTCYVCYVCMYVWYVFSYVYVLYTMIEPPGSFAMSLPPTKLHGAL